MIVLISLISIFHGTQLLAQNAQAIVSAGLGVEDTSYIGAGNDLSILIQFDAKIDYEETMAQWLLIAGEVEKSLIDNGLSGAKVEVLGYERYDSHFIEKINAVQVNFERLKQDQIVISVLPADIEINLLEKKDKILMIKAGIDLLEIHKSNSSAVESETNVNVFPLKLGIATEFEIGSVASMNAFIEMSIRWAVPNFDDHLRTSRDGVSGIDSRAGVAMNFNLGKGFYLGPQLSVTANYLVNSNSGVVSEYAHDLGLSAGLVLTYIPCKDKSKTKNMKNKNKCGSLFR